MMFSISLLLMISGALGASLRSDGDFCPLFCNNLPDNLLCGSDRVTYRNQCIFHKARCMDPSLTLLHDGACKRLSRGIICTTPMCWPTNDPVCGSDGTTYMNECFLNNAMCDNESLKVEHRGTCTPTFD